MLTHDCRSSYDTNATWRFNDSRKSVTMVTCFVTCVKMLPDGHFLSFFDLKATDEPGITFLKQSYMS